MEVILWLSLFAAFAVMFMKATLPLLSALSARLPLPSSWSRVLT